MAAFLRFHRDSIGSSSHTDSAFRWHEIRGTGRDETGEAVLLKVKSSYMINCTSEQYRKAYSWQRGGMAEYLLAEEKDLVALPDSLTYSDVAQV